ncbi:MAG: substrate-binding domain-containing protein [Gammaproteobacteria bacterium]|nr:substrate-binding domain-containing protein [Gammaproteobacteria bacterium]
MMSCTVFADSIRLATTTSTYNSGLMEYLLGHYAQVSDTEVQVISVGTGKALKMAENGDVDLVMTHAPAAEARFVAQGFGIEAQSVMYNDFVLVGPQDDDAKVRQVHTVTEGLSRIAKLNKRFISRGDDSGTHKKELQLWKHLGAAPTFDGYLESGRGMGHSLQMASEMSAYTMTDRGTWLALKDKLQLRLVLESDPKLLNPYQVMLVNPARHPHVNINSARRFSLWLISPEGQKAIGSFRIHGEVLFVPSAK